MKVLFIGFGSIARKHVIALKKLVPEVKIYALRRERKSSFEKDVTNIFGWDNIPKDIDFILITNPTSEHGTTLKKAIAFNKPIFLEKPPLHELSNSEELVALVRDTQSLIYTAFNMRFHPLIMWCKDQINTQDVLEVSAYCGSYLPGWRPTANYTMSYSAIAQLGGGVHLDLIHELDYLTYLFGAPQSVQSNFRKVSDLKIDSIDSASYWLNFNSFTASVRLNYFRKDAKRILEIVEKNRTLLVDLIQFRVVNQNGEVLFSAEKDIQESYNQQMAFFLQVVEKKSILMNDFESSIKTLKICLNEK